MAFLTNDNELDFCRNKVILKAVLEKIYSLSISNSLSPIKVNGNDFEDNSVEFALRYIESPETMLLILEENKQRIMYSVADNKNEKPNNWTPIEYYDNLYDTVCLLYYLTNTSNCLWINEFITPLYQHYMCTNDEESSNIDFIITSALNEIVEDDFWNKEVSNILENDTIETYKEKIIKYLSEFISNKETTTTLVDRLFKIWDKEIEDNPEDFKEDEDKFCSYRFLMSLVLSPENILNDLEDYFDTI